MSSPSGSFELSTSLIERGVDLSSLGVAYLAFLATCLLTAVAFVAARSLLVISPNRGSRDYGTYVSLTLFALLVAIVLENEFMPAGNTTLHYVIVPQLVALLAVHLVICSRQEPWLVALGGAASTATLGVGASLAFTTNLLGPVYWIALVALGGLLVLLWLKSISTRRAFVNASSIYISSKETPGAAAAPQKPWLGLPQWVALIGASVGLGIANSLLRGGGSKRSRPSRSPRNPPWCSP